MYRNPTTARAAFDAAGRLRALVADGPAPLAFLDVPEGGAPLTREQVAEHLAALDRDGLAAVVEAAIAEGQAIAASDAPITSDVLARINLLGDARELAEERQQTIETEAAEAQAAAEAALARLAPPAAQEGEAGDEETPEGETEAPANLPAPQPVTASARPRRGGAVVPPPGVVPSTRPAPAAPTGYTPLEARRTLVAAAGLGAAGLESGQAISSAHDLGEAFDRRRHALRSSAGGDGEQVLVASVRTDYPEERQLGPEAQTNTQRIDRATSREVLLASAQHALSQGALVAAGGLCAPLAPIFDVEVIGSAARPVRDALTNFTADRGGIRWREHINFGDMAGATSVWTLANDQAVGTATPPPAKPCLDVTCPGDFSAFVEAITLCLTFSNVTSRFDPEGTAANIGAANIAHSRFAENRLLAQIAALSTTLTGGQVLGTARDILNNLDKLIAAYRNFYRIDDGIALRMVNPRWLRDMIRVDMTRGLGSTYDASVLAVTDAAIAQWFAARNINPTWHLDGRAATVAGAGEIGMVQQFYNAFTNRGGVPNFPSQVESFLWVEGEMLHLDGGTLDLGIVRDSTLNQNNRYKMFSESFEGVAHRGIESIRLVSTVIPTGAVSGTVAVTAP